MNDAGYVASGLNETLTFEQVLAELDTSVVGAHRVSRAALRRAVRGGSSTSRARWVA